MVKIEMYCTAMCGYCVRAEMLLNKKGAQIEKIRVDLDPDRLREMLNRAQGRRTVPQIFINNRHIGGFDDLYELDLEGELEPLLQLGAS